jgi:hypothetical protein
MHLLYLDDAGSAKNPKERYLVLGGVAVFEAQAHWITREMDNLAASIDAASANAIEFSRVRSILRTLVAIGPDGSGAAKRNYQKRAAGASKGL